MKKNTTQLPTFSLNETKNKIA